LQTMSDRELRVDTLWCMSGICPDFTPVSLITPESV